MEKKYKVQWDYKSGLGGPFRKGEEVLLNEDLAEHINRDSPGVLKNSKTAEKASPPKGKTAK